MSFPGSGLQAIYRNSLAEVCRFLTMKHGKSYMIWNLSEHTYDYKSFDNRIMDCPFPDHHAPPMDLLFSCLQTLDSWIRSAEDHIAVLHCVPEDHEILTERGFMDLDAYKAATADGSVVRVAGYNKKTKQLLFEVPRRLVENARATQKLVEFSSVSEMLDTWSADAGDYGLVATHDKKDDGQMSLLVTPGHDMFVQTGSVTSKNRVSTIDPPRKVKASQLLNLHGMRHVAVAEAGFAGTCGATPPYMAALGLTTNEQGDAWLELYGFWLGNGSLSKCYGLEQILFSQRKAGDVEFLEDVITRIGLVRDTDWACISTTDNRTAIQILKQSWVDFFRAEYADERGGGADDSDDDDERGAAAERDYSCWSLETQRRLTAATNVPIVMPERPRSRTEPECTKSAKWFASWTWTLGRDRLRAVIRGLWRADGSWARQQEELGTSSTRFRDEIVRVLLMAGYSARFKCVQLEGDVRWRVLFADGGSAACRPITSKVRGEVREREYTGRTWCFEMPSGFIMTRRAHKNAAGVVTKASRAILTGNCMGGKGRTGTIIICYLFFSQMKHFGTIEAARQLFARKRSAIEKGIVQPSQIRYVQYFSDILDGTADIVPRALTLESMRMQRLPEKLRGSATERLEIEIYDYTTTASVLPEDKPLWASYWPAEEGKYAYDAEADIATVRLDLAMSGDILIKGCVEKGKKYKPIFLCTINTSFVDTSAGKRTLRFMRKDLDLAFKDKKMGWDEEFQLDVTVLPAPNFAGAMQQTTTWGRMRDGWQAKFPSLVKTKRDPVGLSQSAKRAEEIARDSRLAAIAQQRALPTLRPSAQTAAAAGATPAVGWVAGDSLRRQRAGNALPLGNRPAPPSPTATAASAATTATAAATAATAAAATAAAMPATPSSPGRVFQRRETKSHIKLHVTGYNEDDDADEETEETFEFDVDNDENPLTMRRGAPAGASDNVTEVQWMNFAELNEIESQVMQMQQDMDNAFLDLDGPQGYSTAAPAGYSGSISTPRSVDTIIRELGAAVGADDVAATAAALPAAKSSPSSSGASIPIKYRGPAGEDLSAYVWYRPDMNRQMAEEVLRDCPIGSFVVRPSSQVACLALSHKDEEYGVGHMLLRYWNLPNRKGYSRESELETYASVVDVLHSLPLRFDDEPTPAPAPAPILTRTSVLPNAPLPNKAAPIAPKAVLRPVETEPALPDDDSVDLDAALAGLTSVAPTPKQDDGMVDMLRFF
jgi:hypothetical protein